MANQPQNQPTINRPQSTMRVIAARIKLIRLLSVAAVALFLFAGTAHADILVSNYTGSSVDKYLDDGTHPIPFLSDAAAAEGVQCVKLSSNEVYVASATDNIIRVYNLITGGAPVSQYPIGPVNPNSRIVALAMNADGSVLYAADDHLHKIFALNLPIDHLGAACTSSGNCNADTPYSLDVVVGPDKNVYATNRFTPNLGVKRFSAADSTGWNPGNGTVVISGTTKPIPGYPVLAHAGAMVFDGSNNLWVDNTDGTTNDGIFEFTGPTNPKGAFLVLNFTPDKANPNNGAYPLGMDVSPKNPSAPPFDLCGGCIVVAEFSGKGASYPNGDVDQIDPILDCSGTIAAPGTCHFHDTSTPFIPAPSGRPKYLRFTDNCNDRGYVEICKMSCLTNPVTGNFTFDATHQGFDSGPLTIPVNSCTGAIQIPNGTATIYEQLGQNGTEVSDITAYDYDYRGDQISALLSANLPFQQATVNVVSGDISTETVVGFTNCASGPGELKICKVAGQGVPLNKMFKFEVDWGFFQQAVYYVPAGPPPGGYCEIAGSYPVGTVVDVSEPALDAGTGASNITVAPADRGGFQRLGGCSGGFFSVCPFQQAIIDSGTTEVTFTNTTTMPRPR